MWLEEARGLPRRRLHGRASEIFTGGISVTRSSASAAPATRDEIWLAQAIQRYHALCADPALAGPHVVGAFAQAQAAAGLTFGGTVLCRSLRPAFVTPSMLATLCAAVEDFWSAIGVVEGRATRDASLARALGLSDAERQLAAIDPGYADATVVSRLDMFVADRPRVLEYNADSPAGMSYQAGQAALMRELPVFRRFAQDQPLEEMQADQTLRWTLLDVWAEFARRTGRHSQAAPSVAILDLPHAATRTEFELAARDFQAHGLQTCIVTPEDLQYQDGSLLAFGRRIDLVYKRLLVSDFLARYDLGHPLIRAYAAGAVCVASSFRCAIAHKKRALAVLTDPAHAAWFSESQRASIARLVAPTWSAQALGEEALLAGREQLALKANDGHGGDNVYLGWECDAAQWRQAVSAALAGDYVAQQRVPAALGCYPVFDADLRGGGAVVRSVIEDRNAYVFRGRLGGVLTRLSENAVINVSLGGQAIPTFICDPRPPKNVL